MPRILTASFTAEPGGVRVRVLKWKLPDSPYPIVLAGQVVGTAERWESTETALRAMARALIAVADGLASGSAERADRP